MSEAPRAYLFGPFRLEARERRLLCHDRVVRLSPRALDVLVVLVSNAGSLVTREHLLEEVWGGAFVEEANVTHTVWVLRQALEVAAGPGPYVETIPKAGYRFVAQVEPEGSAPAPEAALPAGQPVVPVGPAVAGGGGDRGDGEAESDALPAAPAFRIRRLHVAVLAGLLAVGIAAWAWRAASPRAPVTVAVLPFDRIGGDPEQEYLVRGLTEETTASLGQIDPDRIRVIGRTSSERYRDTNASLESIGRELGADYLVEGSVRGEAGKVRVTTSLIRAEGQTQVWSRSFDREPRSLLALQRELSEAIARQIGSRLVAPAPQAAGRRHTHSPEAFDLYLRGRYLWHQLTPETNRRAIEYYERATQIDEDYALAWAGIGLTLTASPINSDTAPLDVRARARDAVSRAVASEPDLPETQAARGHLDFFFEWDWASAEASFRRAIELDPSDSFFHRMLGHVLSQRGSQMEATAALARARSVDPFEPMNHAISSQVAFQGRDFTAAAEHARRALAIDPEFWIGHIQLGQALEQLGSTGGALAGFAEALRLSGGNSKALAFRAHALAASGRDREAREVLAALESTSRERYVPPYAIALVRGALGEDDAAFAWLQRAIDQRDVHLVFLPVDPRWDRLRDDPRFQQILRRCGFET